MWLRGSSKARRLRKLKWRAPSTIAGPISMEEERGDEKERDASPAPCDARPARHLAGARQQEDAERHVDRAAEHERALEPHERQPEVHRDDHPQDSAQRVRGVHVADALL